MDDILLATVSAIGGGFLARVISAITADRSSNVKSCIEIIDELKERVTTLEIDNKSLQNRLLSEVELRAGLQAKVSQLEQEVITLRTQLANQ